MKDKMQYNIQDLVEKSNLFSSLPTDELLQLLPVFEVVQVNHRHVVFMQGDESDYLYILLEGELKTILTKPSGSTVVVGHIFPVETVGELGVLSGEPRSMTIEAVEDSLLLKLPSDVFKKLCENHLPLLQSISQKIVERSLNNIKFISHEAHIANAVIIYPLVMREDFGDIKESVRKYLSKTDMQVFSTDEYSLSEIYNVIEESKAHASTAIILMDKWSDNLLEWAERYSIRTMLMLKAESDAHHSDDIKDVFIKLNKQPRLLLDLILLHKKNTKHNNHTKSFLQLANFKLHHHVGINNALDYDRLYRMVTGRAIGLVLGGGGGRGLVHVGIFKALHERKIQIDAIGGTSIGAGMAACYALTNGEYEETIKLVTEIKDAMVASVSSKNIVWPLTSIYSSNPATDVMQNVFGKNRVEDLHIPYFAISADLGSQREVVHDHGLIWEVVRASGSIPAVFPPMVIDNRILLDGGLLNNLPVDVMREKLGGGHTIIASSLSKPPTKQIHYNFPPVIGVGKSVLYSLGINKEKIKYPSLYSVFRDSLLLGSSYSENKNAHAADILIRPNLEKFNTLYITKKDEEALIEIGYRYGLEMLDKYFRFKNEK